MCKYCDSVEKYKLFIEENGIHRPTVKSSLRYNELLLKKRLCSLCIVEVAAIHWDILSVIKDMGTEEINAF